MPWLFMHRLRGPRPVGQGGYRGFMAYWMGGGTAPRQSSSGGSWLVLARRRLRR